MLSILAIRILDLEAQIHLARQEASPQGQTPHSTLNATADGIGSLKALKVVEEVRDVGSVQSDSAPLYRLFLKIEPPPDAVVGRTLVALPGTIQ